MLSPAFNYSPNRPRQGFAWLFPTSPRLVALHATSCFVPVGPTDPGWIAPVPPRHPSSSHQTNLGACHPWPVSSWPIVWPSLAGRPALPPPLSLSRSPWPPWEKYPKAFRPTVCYKYLLPRYEQLVIARSCPSTTPVLRLGTPFHPVPGDSHPLIITLDILSHAPLWTALQIPATTTTYLLTYHHTCPSLLLGSKKVDSRRTDNCATHICHLFAA